MGGWSVSLYQGRGIQNETVFQKVPIMWFQECIKACHSVRGFGVIKKGLYTYIQKYTCIHIVLVSRSQVPRYRREQTQREELDLGFVRQLVFDYTFVIVTPALVHGLLGGISDARFVRAQSYNLQIKRMQRCQISVANSSIKINSN